MLVHLLDLETKRRHREKTGTGAIRKEFAKMKEHLVFTGFNSKTVRNWMIELAVWSEPAFRDPGVRRVNPPYLDTQACRRPSACNIDRMNRYAACHLASCLLSAGV